MDLLGQFNYVSTGQRICIHRQFLINVQDKNIEGQPSYVFRLQMATGLPDANCDKFSQMLANSVCEHRQTKFINP